MVSRRILWRFFCSIPFTVRWRLRATVHRKNWLSETRKIWRRGVAVHPTGWPALSRGVRLLPVRNTRLASGSTKHGSLSKLPMHCIGLSFSMNFSDSLAAGKRNNASPAWCTLPARENISNLGSITGRCYFEKRRQPSFTFRISLKTSWSVLTMKRLAPM